MTTLRYLSNYACDYKTLVVFSLQVVQTGKNKNASIDASCMTSALPSGQDSRRLAGHRGPLHCRRPRDLQTPRGTKHPRGPGLPSEGFTRKRGKEWWEWSFNLSWGIFERLMHVLKTRADIYIYIHTCMLHSFVKILLPICCLKTCAALTNTSTTSNVLWQALTHVGIKLGDGVSMQLLAGKPARQTFPAFCSCWLVGRVTELLMESTLWVLDVFDATASYHADAFFQHY